MTVTLELALFALALAASVFFAACETALLSVSLSAWDRLRVERPRLNQAYAVWSQSPSLVLATILFGNTLANLGASVIASSLLRHLAVRIPLSTGAFLIIASSIAGGSILIIGEILPKLRARHAQDRVLANTAPALSWLTRALRPLLSGLAAFSEAIISLLTREPREPLMTTDELRSALADTRSEGLSPADRRILTNIMAFDQVKVSEVMIPRANIVAIRMEQNAERMFEHIVRAGFSRLPVYFGTLDNVVGIVFAKDLLVEWRSSGLVVLEDLLRPPYRIAPEAPLAVLLPAFRQGHHMAIVTDTHGRTVGLVTIEDAVEAIVGDIADEFDPPQGLYF